MTVLFGVPIYAPGRLGSIGDKAFGQLERTQVRAHVRATRVDRDVRARLGMAPSRRIRDGV